MEVNSEGALLCRGPWSMEQKAVITSALARLLMPLMSRRVRFAVTPSDCCEAEKRLSPRPAEAARYGSTLPEDWLEWCCEELRCRLP